MVIILRIYTLNLNIIVEFQNYMEPQTSGTLEQITSGEPEFVIFKVGGSSSAGAAQHRTIVNLTRKNKARRMIVISAPGETEGKHNIKFTDLAIAYANRYAEEQYGSRTLPEIEYSVDKTKATSHLTTQQLEEKIVALLKDAYFEHESTHGLVEATMQALSYNAKTFKYTSKKLRSIPKAKDEWSDEVKAAYNAFIRSTIAQSRKNISQKQHSVNVQHIGELFNAYNISGAYRAEIDSEQRLHHYQHVVVLDPRKFIKVNGGDPLEGDVLQQATQQLFKRWKAGEIALDGIPAYDKDTIYVFPGYIGENQEGETSLLGRDGTNRSFVQAILGLNPDFGENFSDVKGVLEVTPKFKDERGNEYALIEISDNKVIKEITPKEFLESAYRLEFKVFQGRALADLDSAGVFPEIQIKSFENEHERGTAIVCARNYGRRNINGIGVKKVVSVKIDDHKMSEKPGYLGKAADTLRDMGYNIRHTRDPETEITFYVDCPAYKEGITIEADIKRVLTRELKLNNHAVDVKHGEVVVGVIGGEMDSGKILADLSCTLSKGLIDFAGYATSSKTAMYFVVKADHIKNAVKLLHDTYL